MSLLKREDVLSAANSCSLSLRISKDSSVMGPSLDLNGLSPNLHARELRGAHFSKSKKSIKNSKRLAETTGGDLKKMNGGERFLVCLLKLEVEQQHWLDVRCLGTVVCPCKRCTVDMSAVIIKSGKDSNLLVNGS